MHVMGIVAGITATISKADARGGKVLSLLHEQTLGSIGDSKAQDLCLSLTQAATVPYMNILETWIYKGVISDPQKEVFYNITTRKIDTKYKFYKCVLLVFSRR